MRQKNLIIRLKRQRDLLDELISRIGASQELDGVSGAYDATTIQIEKNLRNLRRFLITTK